MDDDYKLAAIGFLCLAFVATASVLSERKQCLTGHTLDAMIAEKLQTETITPKEGN